jgi:hypothetical protein
MKTKFLIAISIVFVLVACKDSHMNIEGRVMLDCNTPIPNAELTVVYRTGGIFPDKYKASQTFYTDKNGYFNYYFTEKKNITVQSIYYENVAIIDDVGHLMNGNHFSFGNIYTKYTLGFVRRIKVNNPYTANDTLHLEGFASSGGEKLIAGPFHDMIVDTVYANLGYPFTEHFYNYDHNISVDKEATFMTLYYINSATNRKWHEFTIPKFCSGQLAEAILVIE